MRRYRLNVTLHLYVHLLIVTIARNAYICIRLETALASLLKHLLRLDNLQLPHGKVLSERRLLLVFVSLMEWSLAASMDYSGCRWERFLPCHLENAFGAESPWLLR